MAMGLQELGKGNVLLRITALVKEAASKMRVVESRGRPKLFGLVERIVLFLLVIFINNSNRYCEAAFEFFQPFCSHKINYNVKRNSSCLLHNHS